MLQDDNPLAYLNWDTMDLSSWDASLLNELDQELFSPSSWFSLLEELISCCQSVLLQTVWRLFVTLGLCFLCRATGLLSHIWKGRTIVPVVLNQFFEILSGLLLLRYFYDEPNSIVLSLIGCLGLGFAIKPIRGSAIPVLMVCAAVLSYCEFAMDPEQWHRERGSVMIVIMKALSFAFDLTQTPLGDNLHLVSTSATYRLVSWFAYALCPASLIFGPWFSLSRHQQRLWPTGEVDCDRPADRDRIRLLLNSLAHVLSSIACAFFCLLWSTCLSSLVISQLDDETYYYKWLHAYLASQSFRFSHYFVSYSSEAFIAALGIGYTKADVARTEPPRSSPNGPIHVTHMWTIEFPRSLVDVVVNWNLPMHTWLKQQVYKPVRVYGHIQAILVTYAASSLLHGFNFQLSAVLFSIGMFAYIEFVLREKLSTHLSACIGSRPCGSSCGHINKKQLWVWLCNLVFSCLAVFQLAYLAVMFDSSEQQVQGYSMRHALTKWSDLGFVGHYVGVATYLVSKCL